MSYSVKEIFYTLQGEGANTGRAAVFCCFTGCNLWSGREEDRHQAVCRFCDTDFVGINGINGGRFASAGELAQKVFEIWKPKENKNSCPLVIYTGGEPLLQLDEALIEKFHEFGFEVAIETNGTKSAPPGIDWICVSPKANAELILRSGNELKLVYPQAENLPEDFEHLDFEHFYLQPLDNENQPKNTLLAAEYCKRNPRWKLSLQTHKIIGLP